MRRRSSHPWPFLFLVLLVDGLSLYNGLLQLADVVALFAQVSDLLVLDPSLPSIDSEEHHRSLVVEEEGLVCVGMEEEGPERERESSSSGEREGESDFIPSHTCSPENDGIPGFVWVWKRKGHREREREREREAAAAGGIMLPRAVRNIKI
jgi:hypothetical protein